MSTWVGGDWLKLFCPDSKQVRKKISHSLGAAQLCYWGTLPTQIFEQSGTALLTQLPGFQADNLEYGHRILGGEGEDQLTKSLLKSMNTGMRKKPNQTKTEKFTVTNWCPLIFWYCQPPSRRQGMSNRVILMKQSFSLSLSSFSTYASRKIKHNVVKTS